MKKNLLLAFAFALAATFATAQETATPKDPAQQTDPAAQTKPDDKSTSPAQDTTGAQSANKESSEKDAVAGESKAKAGKNAVSQGLHDKFASDPSLANVKFQVSKGVVTLTGKVDSKDDVARAKELAMSVDGVKSVRNRLKVASTSAAATMPKTHADSTAAAKSTEPTTTASGNEAPSAAGSIAGNTSAVSGSETSSGSTAPSASASSQSSTSASGSSSLPASDQPSSDSVSLQSTIQDKLKSEPLLSSSSVNVNVTDSTIALSGTVSTGKEKQTAERIAQSYAGNRKVVDRITVTGNGNASSSGSGQATPVQPNGSVPTSANPSTPNGNPPTNQTPPTPEQSAQPK